MRLVAESQGQHRVAISPTPDFRVDLLDILPNIVLPNQKSQVLNLLDFMAGNMLVLLIVSDPRLPTCMTQLCRFAENLEALHKYANVFVVTSTPPDVNAQLPQEDLPFCMLSDTRNELAAIIELDLGPNMSAGAQDQVGITVLIANERMRILRIDRNINDPDYVNVALRFLDDLPRPAPRILDGFAPILHVPKVFESEFCDSLIEAYLTKGNEPSNSPSVVGGKLKHVFSTDKIRRDHFIEDQKTNTEVLERIAKRTQPEIMKAFTRQVTGVEECKVVCYEASAGGHFKPHRDNRLEFYAHRRFAMSINLNTGDYEGGFLRFPEYGPDLYRPPRGDAIIYSSSLLHEVTPVTSGRRFVLLAHMFDEESRQKNPKFRR